MEDQQRNSTEPEHLGSEMTSFRPPEHPTEQDGPFPGSVKTLSTNSQRPSNEFDGHQVDTNITPIQGEDKDDMRDIAITTGINPFPGASSSCHSTAQELHQLFHRDVLDVHGIGATRTVGYFLERCELKSLAERGESTPMFEIDGLDTESVRESATKDAETTDNESYSLAESTQEFFYSSIRKSKLGTKEKHTNREESMEVDDTYWSRSCLKNDDNASKQSSLEQKVLEPMCQDFPLNQGSISFRRRLLFGRYLSKPEPAQSFDHPIMLKSSSRTKQHRTTDEETTEVDAEYCQGSNLNNDIISEQSSLEQAAPEPRRQWKIRWEDFRPSSSTVEKCRLLLLMLIMITLSAASFVLFLLIGIYVFSFPS